MARHRGPKKPPTPKKPPLTHFLCVPLVTPTTRAPLEASLKEFGGAVSVPAQSTFEDVKVVGNARQGEELRVVHPKAIRPVGALHLTLGVMSLDRDKLSEALDYLNSEEVRNLINTTVNGSMERTEREAKDVSADGSSVLESPITPPNLDRSGGPLIVQLRGLASMHAVHKSSILYIAPTDESGRLYPFCVALQKLFREKGFLVEDDRQLKLHATIVNTIYAKSKKRPARRNSEKRALNRSVETSTGPEPMQETATPSGSTKDHSMGHGPDASAPLKIDASAILEKYKDFVWAEDVVLDRVAICEMGAKKIFDSDGRETGAEYTEVASVSLPG